MRRLNSVFEILVVATVAGGVGFLLTFGLRRQLAQAQTAVTPFTANIVEEHFLNGTAKVPTFVNYITVERRSDASEATSTTVEYPDNQVRPEREILDANSLKHIILEPLTKSTTTFYLSEKEFKAKRDWGRCPTNLGTLDQHSTILGYDTVRYRVKFGSRDRYETHDAWIAPDLGCFVLRETDATSEGSWNERTVVSITKGEPTASMFNVPSDYIERSPRQFASLWSTQFPGSVFMPEAVLQTAERNYEAHQPIH